MDFTLFIIILIFLIIATINDKKKMIIPKFIPFGLLLINLGYSIYYGTIVYSLISLIISIPISTLLFKYRILGGGDLKFLIAFYTGSFLIWNNPIIQNLFFMLLAFFIAHVYLIIIYNVSNVKEKMKFPFMPCLLYSFLITHIIFLF